MRILPAASWHTPSLLLALIVAGCSGTEDGGALTAPGNDPAASNTTTASTGGGGGGGSGSTIDFSSLTPAQQAALAACEQSTGNQSFEDCPVQVLCSSLDPSDILPITVTFEALTDTCPWTDKTALDNADDLSNLTKVNGATRARVEQVRDLAPQLVVPAGQAAVFCSVDISVTSLREDGQFRYDDDLLFLFGGNDATSGAIGGALLTTRNASMPAAMTKPVPELDNTNWPLYRWSDIVDIGLSNSNTALHCLGYETIDAQDPECALPETQQNGAFFMNLTKDTAERLGLRAALNQNYNLSLVMTGDNDSGPDCKHDGFEATVNVGYIVLPELTVQQLKPGLI